MLWECVLNGKVVRPPTSLPHFQPFATVEMVLRSLGELRPRVFDLVTEEIMAWTKPKFVEVACGMEVTRYAPADGGEPILF